MSASDDKVEGSPEPPASSDGGEFPDDSETRIGLEIGGVYLLALALVLALTLTAPLVPFVSQNLYAFVAAVFVGIPYLLLTRRDMDFDRFGLTWDDWQRGAGWGLAFSLATLIPFAGGYWVWATQFQDQQMNVSADNYYQWVYSLDGRPTGWGDEAGAWFWTQDQQAHVGLRAGKAPLVVRLSADRPFRPYLIGAVESDSALDENRKRWTLSLRQPQSRGQVVVGRGTDVVPRRITVKVRSPGQAVIRAGPDATEHGQSFRAERRLNWILLWVGTQLIFIALPEEFFYRGYVQTRIGDFLRRRRERRGKAGALPTLWGFGIPNAVASVLFAAGHLFVPVGGAILANRASVFFPSLLFGWLRDRNDTIAGAVVYHAASNMMVLLTAPHFF